MDKNLTKTMSFVANRLMNNIQMGLSYKPSWSEEFSYKEVVKSYERTLDELKNIIGDVTSLSAEELKELGFKKWDEESDLLLIPIWIFNLIPDGIELTSIDGKKAVKGMTEIDLDVRMGCIAWGLLKERKFRDPDRTPFPKEEKFA